MSGKNKKKEISIPSAKPKKLPKGSTRGLTKEVEGKQTPEAPATPFIVQKSYYNPEKEISRIWYVIIGLVIFVVITFITTFYLIISDFIREKELLLKYYDVYQGYSQDNFDLKDRINEQQIEIESLKNDIRNLKNK